MRRILVLALVFACSKPVQYSESRHAPIGFAELISAWNKPQTKAVHVLFVPDFDIPLERGYGWSSGSGGTAERYSFGASHHDAAGDAEAEPLTIVDDYAECAGRRFDLATGNLFVVEFARNGRSTATQVRRTIASPSDPAAVLEVIKSALPHDARVQALRPTS